MSLILVAFVGDEFWAREVMASFGRGVTKFQHQGSGFPPWTHHFLGCWAFVF